MFARGKVGKIGADLGEEGMGDADANAVDLGEVDPADAVEMGAQVEGRLVTLGLLFGFGERRQGIGGGWVEQGQGALTRRCRKAR